MTGPPGEGRATRTGVVVALVLASVVLGGTGATLASGSPTLAQESPAGPAFAQSGIDPDAVVMRVDVGPGGDARWTVDFRVRLDDDNATAAFESVQSEIERNASAYTTEFASGIRRTVRSAQQRTGREMSLSEVRVDTSVQTLPQRYGVVTYRFEWTNFATVDGEVIRAGDSLSGLFLDAESSLVLAWPAEYEATSVSPEPSERGNNSVTWHGPTDFGPNAPRVVAEPAGGGVSAWPLAAAAVVVVALALGVGWVVRTRTGGDGEGTTARAGTGAGVGTSGAPDGDSGADGDSEPPEELLSNEEKVLRLLDDEGGRIKQQRIASEFDWTDAKTSQVVGKLRDQEKVETFRIGRENVVALPEESDL